MAVSYAVKIEEKKIQVLSFSFILESLVFLKATIAIFLINMTRLHRQRNNVESSTYARYKPKKTSTSETPQENVC
jgi:hypothetical protein